MVVLGRQTIVDELSLLFVLPLLLVEEFAAAAAGESVIVSEEQLVDEFDGDWT